MERRWCSLLELPRLSRAEVLSANEWLDAQEEARAEWRRKHERK